MRCRARVLVSVEATAELKLCVSTIQIVEGDRFEADGLVFEWFTMLGYTPEAARQNCVESIGFYIRCRPELRDVILGALDPTCAIDVRAVIGVTT